MFAIFDHQSKHIGWLYGDNVFDASWNWVAFIDHEHVFSATTLHWLGRFEDGSLRDRSSKPVVWKEGAAPGRGIAPSLPPREPRKPVTPFVAQRLPPPSMPPRPMTPIGGWSQLSWDGWLAQ